MMRWSLFTLSGGEDERRHAKHIAFSRALSGAQQGHSQSPQKPAEKVKTYFRVYRRLTRCFFVLALAKTISYCVLISSLFGGGFIFNRHPHFPGRVARGAEWSE